MNDDKNQRLFLTIALCLAVAFAWGLLFQPKHRPTNESALAGASQNGQPPTNAPGAAPSAPIGAAPLAGPGDVPRGTPSSAVKAHPPSRDLVLGSEKLRVVLTTAGGALKSVELLGAKFQGPAINGKKGEQVNLVAPEAWPLPLSTEVRKSAGVEPLIPEEAGYEVVSNDDQTVVMKTEAGGVTLLKTFVLDPSTYKLSVSYRVSSASAFTGQLVVLETGHGVETKGGMFSSRAKPNQVICQAGGKTERIAVGAKHPVWDGPGPVSFAGIDEQYFLRALVVDPQANATCHIESTPLGALTATLVLPLSIAAGNSTTSALTQFIGPKDLDQLAAVAAPLKEAVDFGFWSIIASFLLGVMKFFYKVVPPHNWGVAIILLTLTIKLVTFPLQHRSMKSMQEMQRIQPQLEAMKKKFAGDTQKQNQEQMKLFKEHGVNPMGSCLPMVIQMPVWFALYTTLGVSVELYHSVFIAGWLNDLTSRDPYYILPVAMGITMVITQILTPSPMGNKNQKMIGYVMSGFFSLIMINLPSGLTLYIFVNNLLSIAQQVYLRKTMKLGGPPASGQTIAVGATQG